MRGNGEKKDKENFHLCSWGRERPEGDFPAGMVFNPLRLWYNKPIGNHPAQADETGGIHMTQTTYLPGHLITIRLYNQPLAQALLDAGIAVEPDTSGVRFACRADPKGTIEVRYGWEEAKDLTRYGLARRWLT